MTAIVGILNKQGVALAADSAVTVNGQVHNSAIKIFSLSKFHPVGVMIYNSAGFIDVPVEIIIKLYREHLYQTSFDDLDGYLNDFIAFLKKNTFFTSESEQENYFLSLIYQSFYSIENDARVKKASINDFIDFLLGRIDKKAQKFGEFEDYSQEEFLEKHRDNILNLHESFCQDIGLDPREFNIDKFLDLIYWTLVQINETFLYTGVVFAGYGNNDIYPSLVSIQLSLAIDGRLRYFIEDNRRANISFEGYSSVIRPFAQTQMMDLIISGASPDLIEGFEHLFGAVINKYRSAINDEINDLEISKRIDAINIDEHVDHFMTQIKEYQRQFYISRLLDAVSFLNKEELAELAESLVYLTFLQKRVTFSSEDVGGAVDVAVITKGDGLIWIKRKHYFKPELNPHFLKNYFNQRK